MVGVPALITETFSCSYPKHHRARTHKPEVNKHIFEGRDWTGVGFDEFAAALDEYIEWYRGGKLKKSLGWRTIRQSREELAAA